MIDEALAYAARGWHVIPVHGVRDDGTCTCGRPGCHTPGKHPIMAGAFDKYASTDPTIVGQWWVTWPDANIGIVCGKISNIWVLDIDGAHGMMELEDFEQGRDGGALPSTSRVRTGSGGLHLFWTWRDEARLRTKIGARFGVDVKANGFVVAPPSRHASGARYTWEEERTPVPAPDDLLRWVKGDPSDEIKDEWPSITDMLKGGLPEGRRDDGMFHAALTLKRSGMRRTEAEAIVERIALRCSPPFPLDQARSKVDAAWKYDEEERARRDKDGSVDSSLRNWAATAGVSGGNGSESAENDDQSLWPGFGGTTDRDNAERLKALWDDARALIGGGWLVWNGELWKRAERPSLDAAHKLHEIITREMQLVDMEHAAALAKWRQACGATARVNAALMMLESEPTLNVNDLDKDPWLLCVMNGVLDLRTGELQDYNRDDYITRRANAEWYDGQVDAPTFKQTLGYGIAGESDDVAAEIAAAIQVFFGVCLTGANVKNFVVLHGPGNTGKSSLIEAFAYALGDYATAAPRGLLTMRRGSNETHPTILTELEGRRFVYASEPGAGEELNVELIKDVTGGAELKARRMRQDFYSFRTEVKPLIDTNHPLRLRDVSPALEERMISIGLLAPVPHAARVSRAIVAERLKLEASGILAWAWRGLQRVLEESGGVLPGDLTGLLGPSLLEERSEAIAEQDIVGLFIRECLEDLGHQTPTAEGSEFLLAADVRTKYVWWSAVEGVTMNADVFMRELRSRMKAGVGLTRRVSPTKSRAGGTGNPQTGWWGIRVRNTNEHTA